MPDHVNKNGGPYNITEFAIARLVTIMHACICMVKMHTSIWLKEKRKGD
jgi:hypothetical protein